MMKREFTKLMAAFALLTFLAVPMGMWGQTTTDVTLSSGTFNNNVITWTCADGNITIQQLKGSGSSNPNSSYISAPRVYKQNILSFVGTNGYTITNIDIKCDGSYYGTTKYAGTEISNNNVENNTTALNPTWSTANGGTHTIATVSSDGLNEIYIQNGHSSDANNQLRITKLTITYKVSGSVTATTVTINTSGLTNTDVYTSTTAGSLSATVKENTNNTVISGATVSWSSSDTNVATIDNNGTVTLVAVGTTTITASYAGGNGYGSSSATYELTVTSSEPYVQPTTIEITPNYEFWGKTGQFSGDTYSELEGSKDNVTLNWTRGSGSMYANTTAMRFYKENELTFTAPAGYEITSIVITFTQAQNDLSFSPEGYSLSETTGTWTGAAATVTMSRPSNASSYATISKFTITLAAIGNAVATTTTINVPQNFNTDIYTNTNAGTLTAMVTENVDNTAISGATVTWSSSNTGVATIDDNGAVTLVAVGTTTITASYAGVEDQYRPSQANYTLEVTSSAPVVDYAELPFEWQGGSKSDFLALNGVTALGLGSDYASNHAPYLIKFDNTGDYIQVKCDQQPGKVTIGVKMIGGSSTSTITIQGSADGETFTNIEALTISGDQNDVLTLETTNAFAATDRYVRMLFDKGSNVGVGPISIALPVNTTETHTLTVDGYTGRFGYVLIASPVTVDPSTVEGMTTGDYDLYYFNEQGDIDGNQWINYKDQNDGGFSLEPGKGYLYAKAATQENPSYSFELTGMPYDGQPIELRKIGNGNFMGWNLVGNPLGETAVLADGRDFYVMNPEGSEFIQSSGAIDPMQGIFVIAEQDREELAFEAAAVATNPIDDNKLVLNLTQGRNVIDRAVVRFGEGRTLPKFMLNPSNTKLYITKDDQDFAVVRSANQGEMPVSFKAAENGTYTLTIAAENVEVSYLHLIDNMSRADIDLLANPSYTFTAQTTDNEDRFTLVYSKANAQTELMTENFDGMSNIATSYSATGWFAYNAGNGNNWTINTSSTYAHSGSNSAQVQYNSSYAANCYLVSAPFTTSPNMTEISVSLYERARSSSYQETFEVFFVKASDVTTAASVTSATQYNAISSQDYTNATYAEVTGSYTSSALAGQDLRVVVHCTSIADRYYLNIDDITVSDNGVITCPKPANLEVTNDGATATATWEGDATDYNISINGTVTNNVTSPYTFEVEPSTTYTVMVEANCTGETSGYCNPVIFTVHCLPQDMCSITLALTDSYSDGWNGGKMEVVDANTSEVYGTYTIESGGSATYELALCPGTVVNFVYTAGSYGTENGWVIYDAGGEVITEEAGCNSGCTHTNGIQATYTMNCSGCFKPKNLTETNVSFTSATLSWEGNNESYVLEYRPWNPAGDDIITTGTLTTYTVDLSQYEGTGSVAIRHYDISDMFQLIVDNIEVTNAGGTVVYSQDFEDCGGNMPAEFSNMDLDGDGFTWQIASSPSSNVDGSYGIVSESYNNDYGALTPDNWLILSGLEMGGQMTFQARGQDPQYAAENFAIYVSTENSIVEVPVRATTYNVTGLTPNTPYACQVKGICGDEETSYVSSFFKTKDDMFVFATAGNWNVVSNWEDAEGNAVTALPTADNNVRIDAAATIPAGVVAVANKATIGTGSITIEDGGQLKQNAASLRVTMEKEIAGYGTSDGNYYFIASPFNGRTLYETSGTFSHVDNMLTGEYDLYAFDAAASDGLEWINYKSEPTHIAFQAENELAGLLYGEGYLYANQEGTTLEFEGTAGKSNNYSETKDYTFDSESTNDFNGWALVGNFFTCNAYINYIDANGNALEADFYTLNSDNTYTLMTSGQPLPPCTGALMNVSATGKVQYSTEAPANSKASMLNITLNQNRSIIDQVRMRFGQGSNMQHMSFRKGSSKVYMPVEGKDYAVVYTENQGEMPVNFKAENNGSYTLSFNTEEVSFAYLHLIDNMTGNDVNLLETPSYSFEAKTTDYESRFKLVFATGNVNDDNFAFFSNGSFVINNEGNATLQVIDVNGRIIKNESINGCANVSINQASGIYMLRLVNGDSVKVQKVVVK